MDEQELPFSQNGQMSVSEVMGLVRLFNDSLLAMEARLGAKMDDNSRIASERWTKHDREFERALADVEKRFSKLETAMENRFCAVEKALQAHIVIAQERWDKEHDEDLILDARLTPVKGAIAYFRRNWKTILLVIMSILAVLGFSSETLRNLAGQ